MSATTIFVIAIIGAGVLTVLGIFAIAVRRGPSAGPITSDEIEGKAEPVSQKAPVIHVGSDDADDAPAAVATIAEVSTDPPVDPLTDKETLTPAEYGVTRRKFLNRALYAVFGLFLAQFALGALAYVWPRLKGGFGTPINAGNLTDLKASLTDGGTIFPVFVPSAQAWIVPFDMSELPGSSYEGVPFVVAGGDSDGVGVMALWQRCVHLGCRVPECLPSQGFECPCHGSRYNIHGEYNTGPAPRNMDRFALSVTDADDLIIETGTVVQTPRSKQLTAEYPQGPFCV
ncbi:MAG: Rieske 2Fe-2S domain-containing protein [Acidimicrobiia bacterium]|jgi:cytochrome b6-f complex iron-sulfur subunit